MSSVTELPTLNLDQDTDVPIETLNPGLPLADVTQEAGLTSHGRPVRTRRKTWKLLQLLPDPPSPVLPSLQRDSPLPQDMDGTSHIAEPLLWSSVKTAANAFGLYRDYPSVPTHNPDDSLSLADLCNFGPRSAPQSSHSTTEPRSILHPHASQSGMYAPFRNSSIFGIMNWMWTGSAIKSLGEVTRLVNFLKSDEFHKEDILNFDIRAETAQLDEAVETIQEESLFSKDRWHELDVPIKVPYGKNMAPSDIPIFDVPGLHLRKLTEVLKSAIGQGKASFYHYTPFKQFWQHPGCESERIYDEMYSSEAFVAEHINLQRQPRELGCTLERVVLGLMFWSDSTHLASFGNASLWPLYLYFSNETKWRWGNPQSGACHHIAYIPKLPDSFHDFFEGLAGEAASAAILTHCRRELMHSVWQLILDNDFLHAYEHGIVIECLDGVTRRFYPRILTYSADYPEKRQTLMRSVTERFMNKVYTASDAIYRLGSTIKGVVVGRLLDDESLVPTPNAFLRLNKFGLDLFQMLVPDLMHEFELGVWKHVFTHLIRILVANGGTSVQYLNQRYRMVPTFGRSTIRRFSDNASAMKKLAAHNYEDLLQCSMPVFEGLLEEPYNGIVLDLLFTLAEWHALAKLRLHTETTLQQLESCTSDLGRLLRKFSNYVCPKFDTRELPREEAARGRRKAREYKHQPSSNAKPASDQDSTTCKGPPKKTFNMQTYKLHSLGDYVSTIRRFGTTDSYSTQTGELEHRRVKKFYARTNKNNAIPQITRLERRERVLERTRQQNMTQKIERQSKSRKQRSFIANQPRLDFSQSEPLPPTPPELHHHISPSHNNHLHIPTWLAANAGDLAITNFLPKLKEHLLACILHPDWTGDGNEFTPEQQYRLLIRNDRLYIHKIFRVNFTTYDVRRDQDSMNPRTGADIMTLSHEEDKDHPFAYARILGVFHADVIHNTPSGASAPTSIEFLWVRWYHVDTSYRAGFKRKRLHRLQFLPDHDPDAYGFVSPDEVIRGAHIIPGFFYGPTEQLPQSIARAEDELDDWMYYYVDIFVDRDMYMRYAGNGVGHYRVNLPEEPTSDVYEDERGDEQELDSLDGPRAAQNASDLDDNSNSESSGPDSVEGDDQQQAEGSDEDLGPEDGEGLYDDEDEEHYAPL
ncbi:hypothetical protein C0992_003455 [Termitomyces sp. T32_za158]|nr:hypothetical protein C0992_003455 [Termitomyces sp. T32_za158]